MAKIGKSSRRRGSSTRRKQLKAKSKRSSDSANFFSFVGGMVCSLLLISIAYSGFRPNDVEQTPNTPGLVLVEGNSVLGISDYEKVLVDGNANDAIKLLKTLNNWPRQASLPLKFDYQRKRIGVANRLIELDCLPADRIFAIESKIDACSLFYGLDYVSNLNLPVAAKQLREAAAPFVDNENDKVRRTAKLGIAKLEVFEYAKQNSEAQLLKTRDAIFSALEDFQGDQYVVENIRVLVRRLIQDDVEVGRGLILDLFNKYKDSESDIVREFSVELNDTLLIADSDYERLVANRWANGEAGRTELVDAVLQLCANPDAGKSLAYRIGRTLAWLEQIHDFEKATAICNALVENAPRHQNVDVAEQTKRMGQSGLKRIAMVGEKLNIDGRTPDGRLDPLDFEDRITVVFFYSHENISAKVISRLNEFSSGVDETGVKLLAVSVDNNFGDIENISQRAPNWTFVAWDQGSGSSTNPILDQYPVVQVPHIILLDHHGIVSKTNLALGNLPTNIEALVNAKQIQNSK